MSSNISRAFRSSSVSCLACACKNHVVNVSTGIATVEPELEDVMRALKANRREILWNVGLPRSMPYFFASLKIDD